MNETKFVTQLEAIVTDYKALRAKSEYNDLGDMPKNDRQALVTRAVSAVYRISGERSAYTKEIDRLLRDAPLLHVHMSSVVGVVQALLADINSGYIQSLVELVHADLFADFLERAQHLLDTGYKDASAVLAGSALEAHLRALCLKATIVTETTKPDGAVVPKKADAMNADLAAAFVYEKLDQKSVTAWLDLRNKAAHGKYTEYQTEQVALMIGGIRDFMNRKPA